MRVVCINDGAFIGVRRADGGVDWPPPQERTDLTVGKIYDVLSEEHGCYRVVDDSGEDYLYPTTKFRVVEG